MNGLNAAPNVQDGFSQALIAIDNKFTGNINILEDINTMEYSIANVSRLQKTITHGEIY